jgi:hypothetical protein
MSFATFSTAFAAFFLLGGAWALALPVNGTYDEKQHLVRAYSVWTGQFIPHDRSVDGIGLPADGIDGPRSLLPANPDCTWWPKTERPKPASCQQTITDRSETVLPTSAGRYSPVYYLAVGLPLRISPDGTGLIWARLLSAALSALFLAAAAMIAVRLGNRLLLAALVLVTTPLALDLNGALNPNGLEISAGVLLFVALMAALTGTERSQYRTNLIMAGIASVVLSSVLHLGVVMAGLVILACFLIAGWQSLRATLRSRTAWLWFGLPSIAGVVFAVAWVFGSGVLNLTVPVTSRKMTTGQILEGLVTTRAEFYARQVVAQFGYGETTVSPVVILLWYLLVAVIVVPALWFAGWRLRLAIMGMFAASYAILAVLELHYAPLVGWYAHSRYIMPLGAGIVLGAAFADRYVNRLRDSGWLDRLVLALVLLTAPVHLYALARVMTRFQTGIDASLNPFRGSWHPAAGSVLPVALCLVGALLLAVMVRGPFVRRTPQVSTANTLSN